MTYALTQHGAGIHMTESDKNPARDQQDLEVAWRALATFVLSRMRKGDRPADAEAHDDP